MKIFLEVCQYIFQNYVIKIYFPSSCSLSWITSSLSEIFKKTGRIGFPDKLIWFSNPILLELRWFDIFRKLIVWFNCYSSVICCFCQNKYPKHLDYENINNQFFSSKIELKYIWTYFNYIWKVVKDGVKHKYMMFSNQNSHLQC